MSKYKNYLSNLILYHIFDILIRDKYKMGIYGGKLNMKKQLKKSICRIFALVFILTVIPFSSFANAATKSTYKPSLSLNLSSKKSYQSSVTINVKTSSKYGIKNIKIKKGKITSTANSKWNSAQYITSSKKYKVNENGYYSVLVTDKKNNKNLKCIKVSNVSYKKYEGVWSKSEWYYDDLGREICYEYAINIKSINGNKIKFKMSYYSLTRISESNTINATIKDGKVDFNFIDSYFMKKRKGTLLLKDNKVYYTSKDAGYLTANNLKLTKFK